jgi:hypothetical protein
MTAPLPPTRPHRTVDAARPWAGGAATAAVWVGLATVVGVVVPLASDGSTAGPAPAR